MSKTGGIFTRRKGKFSVNPRRPTSALIKSIYFMAGVSVIACGADLAWSIYMNGETGKVAGGIGVVFLVIELVLTGVCISRIRNEAEPGSARILSVFLSAIALGVWLSVYLLGVFSG